MRWINHISNSLTGAVSRRGIPPRRSVQERASLWPSSWPALPMPQRSGAAAVMRWRSRSADHRRHRVFVKIGSDDTVTVMIKHLEMGQGPYTGLATLVAEELDADWSQMRATGAPSNADAVQESRVRHPGHWRIDGHCEFLRADAQGRCDRACHAGGGGGADLGRAGRAEITVAQRRRPACRHRASRRDSASSPSRRRNSTPPQSEAQRSVAVHADRQHGAATLDTAGEIQRQAIFTIDVDGPES